jgi:hypothetical protein
MLIYSIADTGLALGITVSVAALLALLMRSRPLKIRRRTRRGPGAQNVHRRALKSHFTPGRF